MIKINNLSPFDIEEGTTLSVDASHGYTVLGSSRLYLLDVANGLTKAFHCYAGSNYIIGTEHIVSPKNQLYDPTTGIGWVYEYSTPEELLNGSQYQFMLVTYLPSQSYLPNPSSIDMRVDASIKQEQWLLQTPTVSFNLDVGENELNTTKYTITATYNDMLAPVNNSPDYTIYSLYNYDTDELLEKSSPVYTSGVMGENGNYLLSYEFSTNLTNDQKYYADIEVHSILDMTTTDPMAKEKIFVPDTPTIPISVITAENMRCDGYVDIKSSITNINGTLKSGNDPDDYITSHGIDLHEETLVYKDDVRLPNNYNFTLWGNDFEYAEHIYERSPEYVIHMSAPNEVDGIIDIYMIKDDESLNHKAVMYVYPLGYYAGESHYYESLSVPIPNAGIDEYTAIMVQYADYTYAIDIDNVVIGDTVANP